MFAAAGWQVITLKYGRFLTELFDAPGGDHLKARIDGMSNPEYQRLLRCSAAELRDRLPGDGAGSADVRALLDGLDDADVTRVIRGLGGHDIPSLVDAFDEIDDTRPTVIFAYTIKGNGLPNAGHPQNHSNLLKPEQLALVARAARRGRRPTRGAGFAEGSDAAALCARTAERLHRGPARIAEPPAVPADFGREVKGHSSTQQALGRLLLDLTRLAPEAARRVVTVAPDVASSTNLGGWVNKAGVWSSTAKRDWFADDAETILHWDERPTGQHIELGIAEVNLVSLLGELGATWSRWGEPLLPIGTLYDPFVTRALEPWSFGVYGGGQSILIGTPSGVTLAAEGGAHQSIITPSIGIEQPGVVAFEPAFVQDFEWCMLDALGRLGRPDGSSSYFRLTSRVLDQGIAAVPTDPAARERRRRQVVAGGYALRRVADPPSPSSGWARSCPRCSPPPTGSPSSASPPTSSASRAPTGSTGRSRARSGHASRDAGAGDPAIIDQLFPADRAVPDGHRARRSPAHPGVPRRRPRCPQHQPRRDRVRADRNAAGAVPPARHRPRRAGRGRPRSRRPVIARAAI